MIKADIKSGVELKGNRLTLGKEFVAIYYALEKADPDLLDAAIDIIEKQAADGLEADDFIKKVVDLHYGLSTRMKSWLRLLMNSLSS